MFDVLFLAYDDNANTGHRFWRCARELGLNAAMFKGKSHPFGYPEQAPLHPSLMHEPICFSPATVLAPGLESLVESSKIIHLIASTFPMVGLQYKNVVVQHGGSSYRQNPEACNNVFNPIVSHSIIQCPDLLGLGAKNEKWIYYPVDTVSLKPHFTKKGDVPIIGHFPSNPNVKGTVLIERVIRSIANERRFVYIGSADRVPWTDNLKRMIECDIIIEGCAAKQENKVYGEWGNTALEASALGCSVVTHCLSKDKYESEFGHLAPRIANTEEELRNQLLDLLKDWDTVQSHKVECRKWAEENHSIPVTAKRLWNLVYKEMLGKPKSSCNA